MFAVSRLRLWVCCLGALVVLLAGASVASAAQTLTVNTTADDTATGVGGCTTGGSCTLREAVAQANLDNAGDTIIVPSGTYAVSSATGFGAITLSGDMTIQGAGPAGTIIDGGAATSLFSLSSPAAVTMTGVTLQNGASGDRGGGVFINVGAALTISDAVLTGNTMVNGGGAVEDRGTLIVRDSTFTNNGNPSGGRGGAIEVGDFGGGAAAATINDSTFSGNHAVSGAGIEIQNNTQTASNVVVTITGSTFTGNTATSVSGYAGGAGAIEDDQTVNPVNLSVTNSTITGNTALSAAGQQSYGGGVALANNGGSQLLINDTIAGNSATGGTGGDVFADPGSTPPQFENTIITGGSAVSGPDCSGPIASLGHNLERSTDCGFTGSGDLQNKDPRLGPLQDNGGPTLTMALAPGSPAIDAGGGAPCAATTDQRGVARPQGAGCDIGAYESAPPVPGSSTSATTTSTGAAITAAAANPDVQNGTIAIQYGASVIYGAVSAPQPLPAGSSASLKTFTITGLSPGTVYHYRVVASDPDGTAYGPDQTLTTLPPPPVPTVTTLAAGSIGTSTATLHATVNPNGALTTAEFRYGTSSTLAGAQTTAQQVVGAGTAAVAVPANLSGLKPGKKYYFRVVAANSVTGASASGSILSFTTKVPLKHINATMAWTFPLFRKYATVTQLMVDGVPLGATVTVTCRGHGCPFGTRRTVAGGARCAARRCTGKANVNLARPFKHRHLAYGTRITVRITRSGYIGKAYVFKMGRSVQPKIGCLAPGSSTPGKGC
jgi:hypothetical protein